MAVLSGDKQYVTVQKGDTLWGIASTYLGSGAKYKQLAAINNISNADYIYVGQKIYLYQGGAPAPSPSSTTVNTSKPTIKQFGEQSNADNVLFATWDWGKSGSTESYKVLWTYDTGNGVWFVGTNSNLSVDENAPSLSAQSTYSIPANAKRVQFKIKPIAKSETKDGKETKQWIADWSETKTWTNDTPLETPSVPSIEIDKYKLTASVSNCPNDAAEIHFQVVKNNSSSAFATGKAKIVSDYASYAFTVDAGADYKVRCRAYKNGQYSEWSEYSGNEGTIPATPANITVCRASSRTSIYLEWTAAGSAETYDIEFATKKEYFDISDQATVRSGIELTKYDCTGLETGHEYFFRVRAVNDEGYSPWSGIKSVSIGKPPAAPTTWSSTTTVITGEDLILYWVHNSADGSSQIYGELELYHDGVKETHTITNSTDEDEKDKTSFYTVDTNDYPEGTKIEWRVRTSGVTNEYGDWSVMRTVDVYAPPTIELRMIDADGNALDNIESFPFYISALTGPATQAPIGYYLTVVSNQIYETVDNIGNPKIVNVGEAIYSKYFDITSSLMIELSAGNIDLENGMSYTINCTAAMNSGLKAEGTLAFVVNWSDVTYQPNAEISVDPDTFVAYIKPYCNREYMEIHRVERSGNRYEVTEDILTNVWGELVRGAKTLTGELVYSGVTDEDEAVYYCSIEVVTPVEDISLAVYRREFDGTFTEIASGLDNAANTTVTDPHPSLDYARYRIVATDILTGAVSYYDMPGYPVGGIAIVIQWNEAWISFNTNEEIPMEQPAWSGSLLKLPYNVDVSPKYAADVSLVNYIGRSHPVSYYGTHLGESATWNTIIEATDKETLYALRRLAIWMGDVYVREPSGSGYWARVVVSFNKNHCEVSIPVTLDITRVEGGI